MVAAAVFEAGDVFSAGASVLDVTSSLQVDDVAEEALAGFTFTLAAKGCGTTMVPFANSTGVPSHRSSLITRC